MDLRVLDELDALSGEQQLDGLFDFLGSAIKTVATKALPIVQSVYNGQGSGSSTIVGAVAAYANAKTQKKVIDAQARLAAAKSEQERIAAEAAIQKANIDAAAAQTVVNGINKGIIPPDATYAQAGRIVVQEVVKSAGVNPQSPEGVMATQTIAQAATSNNTMLLVGGIAAAVLVGVLLTRK